MQLGCKSQSSNYKARPKARSIIIKPEPAPKIVTHEVPVSGTGTGLAVDPEAVVEAVGVAVFVVDELVLVAVALLVEVDVATDVAVDVDVDVAVDVDVDVDEAVAVEVAVEVGFTSHSDRFVVQAAPGAGQQYCLAVADVAPQISTLPAELHKLSFGNSSPVEQSLKRLGLLGSGQA